MDKTKMIIGIFQSVASKYATERDDALSKINRAFECQDLRLDIESYVAEQLDRLINAKVKISLLNEELTEIFAGLYKEQGVGSDNVYLQHEKDLQENNIISSVPPEDRMNFGNNEDQNKINTTPNSTDSNIVVDDVFKEKLYNLQLDGVMQGKDFLEVYYNEYSTPFTQNKTSKPLSIHKKFKVVYSCVDGKLNESEKIYL